MNARFVAYQILSNVLVAKQSLTHALNLSDEKDKAFIYEMCFGVMRWYEQLVNLANQVLKKPFKAKDYDILIFILLGLYQIIYMRVPNHAAINETINAAKNLKKPWAIALMNAVFRNFVRNQECYLKTLDSISHPTWLLQLLKTHWPKHYEKIITANNQHPPMTLRVSLDQYSRDDYLQMLATRNIPAQKHAIVETAIVLDQAINVDKLPGFLQGAVSVQDAAAQLATLLLDLKPKMNVLDAGAAPGGKTLHLLQSTPCIKLTAIDCDELRIAKVSENLQRAKLNAKIICANANDLHAWWDRKYFERILLDAPCSATGIIRRHPDIKYLRQPTDIKPLQQTQKQLLQSLWQVLKPGGKLLYVTCSILPQENTLQITDFLNSHKDAREIKLPHHWGLTQPHGRQILSGQYNMDGFYYCLLQKIK